MQVINRVGFLVAPTFYSPLPTSRPPILTQEIRGKILPHLYIHQNAWKQVIRNTQAGITPGKSI